MSSFLQYGSLMRAKPAFRPVVIGALTCGALMVPAGAAQAHHRMADGTLCPHAAGTLAPGEAPAAPTAERSASSAPIGTVRRASAPAARPAAKPAVKAPVQRPAVQTQAQRPAASQAQAQRPAAVSQPAVSKAGVSVPAQIKAQATSPAQRQAPVAKPSARQQPTAAAGTRSAAKKQVSRPAAQPVAVMPEITTDRRGAIERPTATAAPAAPADSGVSVSTTMLAGLFGLFGIIGAGVLAARRRGVRTQTVAPAPRLDDSREAAIEAELQAIIAETRARALHAPDDLDEPHEDRELTQTH